MAAGMAHEINNPLTVISASVDVLSFILKKEIPSNHEHELYLDRIRQTVTRITKILNSMKKVSRSDDLMENQELTLKSIFDDLENLTNSRFKKSLVKLTLHLDVPHLKVFANEISLTQVLLNLLNNSFDEVVTKPVHERWVKVIARDTKNKVLIDVVDSGRGIAEKAIEKLFNPFFTTKDVGQGTGLGLSISKALVSKMNGEIYYLLENGHTCFRIELPTI